MKKEGEEEVGVVLQVNEEVDHGDIDLIKGKVVSVGANQGITDEMQEITKVNPKNMITKGLKKRALTGNMTVNISRAQEVTKQKKSTE